MLKNRKGFTLLEILATVTILGLIMTAAIAGYSKYIKKTKTRYYQKQEELLVQAGRDYFNDNRNTLPRAAGETNCVKLRTLLDAKYINKIVDYKQKACNDVDSRVCATKLNKTKYLYHAELNCYTDYKSPDYKTPIVTITPKQGETIIKGKNESETVVATINYDSKIEADKEETDLASYRYVIYKKVGTDYAIYYDSHWITITKPVRTKNVNIELNSTGVFYVEVWAYNIKGKQGHSKSGEVTLDMNLDCEIGKSIKVSNNNSYEFGTWTNKDITTTFNISGGMTKYTLILLDKDNNTIYTKEANIPPKESTSKITVEGIYKYKIIGYNSEGETCEGITDQIKIDKTAPICTVTSNTSNWTNGKITLTATCKDESSGCVQETRKHEVTTSATSSYKFEDIYDKASNKGDCNKVEIKIDNTGPTINVVGYLMKKNNDNSFSYIDNSGNVVSSKEKAAKYTFGTWTKDYVRLFSDGEDKESGLAKNAEVFIKKGSTTGKDSQGVWKNCSTEIPRSYTVQSQGSSDLKFRNSDNTGNKTESEYVNVKLDRTGPTYKMNSVINSDGSVTLTASNIKDSYSGVKEYGKNILCQYQTNNGSSWSSWTNCSTSNSAKISSSSVKKVKFRAQDKVGNITEKEEEVDIDMEAPTLKVTAGRCSDSSSSDKCSNSNFKRTTQVQTAKGNTKNITFTAWSLDGLKINYEVTEENIKEIKWSWNDSNIFDTLNTTIKDSSTTTTKKGTKTLITPGRRYGVITATDMNGKTSKVTITVYISISINVTFNKNDGTTKPAELQQSFNYGQKNNKFEKSFTRSGYTLLGWSNNASATKSDYKIDNDVSDTWILKNRPNTKLYAVWSPNQYNITYDLDGGTHGTNHPTTAKYNEKVTINNPSKKITLIFNAGTSNPTIDYKNASVSKSGEAVKYTFNGWDISGMDDSTHTFGSKTSTAKTLSSIKDTTFKNLRATSGTVTFDAKWTGPDITLPTVTKKGYKCIWESDSNTWSSGGTYTPANTNGATSRTFTASCTANSYTIKYALDGGSYGTNHPTTAKYNESITINNPSKKITLIFNAGTSNPTIDYKNASVSKSGGSVNYTFNGWDISGMDDSTHTFGPKTSTAKTLSSIKDTTFKNLRATSGTVTFEANWTGPNITLPTVTKKGYKCIWKSDSNTWSSGGTYTPANPNGATSRTFTASCTANSYTIKYALDGGSYGTNHPTTANYNEKITINNPSKKITLTFNSGTSNPTIDYKNASVSKSGEAVKYTFNGWDISGMDDSAHTYGTKSSTAKTLSSIKDTTFKNLRSSSGTVTFEANWTGPTITLPTVTKKGYKCVWKSDSSTWSSGGTYTPANPNGATSRTFTASCTANSYTIKYALDGGTYGTNHPTTANYNESITINNPSKKITLIFNSGTSNPTIDYKNASVSKSGGSVNYTFDGWDISGMDDSTHTYGTKTSSSKTLSSIKATTFKNLRATSGTVTFEANWTGPTITLPTVTKKEYKCVWKSDNLADKKSGGTYIPSAATSRTFTASCEKDNPTTDLDGYDNRYCTLHNANYDGTLATGAGGSSTIACDSEIKGSNCRDSYNWQGYGGGKSNTNPAYCDRYNDCWSNGGNTYSNITFKSHSYKISGKNLIVTLKIYFWPGCSYTSESKTVCLSKNSRNFSKSKCDITADKSVGDVDSDGKISFNITDTGCGQNASKAASTKTIQFTINDYASQSGAKYSFKAYGGFGKNYCPSWGEKNDPSAIFTFQTDYLFKIN